MPDLLEASLRMEIRHFLKTVFPARTQIADTGPGLISEGGNHIQFSQVTHLFGFPFPHLQIRPRDTVSSTLPGVFEQRL